MNASMSEKELLTDLLNQQKQMAGNYAVSITESSSPQMRQMLTKQHDMICQDQYQVFSQMSQRGYYVTKSAPAQDVKTAKSNLSKLQSAMK